MKQREEREKRGIWQIILWCSFVVGMCAAIPKFITRASDYLYNRKMSFVKPQEDDDWGPEIVKKSTQEDAEDGEL